MMVLCSRLRRSNMRTLPSAPQLTKVSTLPAQNLTSKTSLSWAMSWVFAVRVGISQMVQVVSMLEVMISFGETLFQSREVRGAVCSGVLEFDSNARGVSFWGADGFLFAVELRLMLLLTWLFAAAGNDHNRKWSPEVASKSVVCFWAEGGSHSILVTGYEHVASAIRVKSRP